MGREIDLSLRGPYTDYSGVVTVGGQSQMLLPANENWNDIFIQNPSDQIESLFVNFGANASATLYNSIELLPGQDISKRTPGFIPNTQINVTAITISHPFVCKAS